MKAPRIKLISSLTAVVALEFLFPAFAGVHVDPNFQTVLADGPVQAVAVASDESIVLGGDFTSLNGNAVSRVARVAGNGAVQSNFGTGANAVVSSVKLGADGKVYLGGRFSGVNGGAAPNIARLAGNGGTDAAFDAGAGPSAGVACMTIDGAGRALIGGNFESVDGTALVFVARLGADGERDSSFASALQSNFAMEAGVSALAVQADGKILAGGVFTTARGFEYLARLNEDGSLDTSFAGDHGSILYTKAILPLANGQVLIAGLDKGGKGFVRRLNPDRSIDASFLAPELDGCVHALAIDRHGRVVVGGTFYAPARGILRLKTDGSINASWNTSVDGFIAAIAIDSKQRILAGGLFGVEGGATAGLVRFVEDGQISLLATNTNVFRGMLRVEVGGNYVIESSGDLKTWTHYGSGVGTTAGLEVIDGTSLANTQRFFRARQVQ